MDRSDRNCRVAECCYQCLHLGENYEDAEFHTFCELDNKRVGDFFICDEYKRITEENAMAYEGSDSSA